MYYDILEIFTILSIVNFIGIVTPGPTFILLAKYAIKKSAKEAFLFVSGILLSDCIAISLFTLGVTTYLNNKYFVALISILGGIFLVLYGINLFSLTKRASIDTTDKVQRNISALITGLFTTILNSGYWLWWGTVGINLIVRSVKLGIIGLIVFVSTIILTTYIWSFMLYISFLKSNFFFKQKNQLVISNICGISLISFGVWFFAIGCVTLSD